MRPVTLVSMLTEASTRLVQLIHPEEGRRVALVDGDRLRLLATYRSAYSFAKAAIELGWKLRDLLKHRSVRNCAGLRRTYRLATPWRFLASFDHSDEPSRCLVSAAGPTVQMSGLISASGPALRGHGDAVPDPGRTNHRARDRRYRFALHHQPRRHTPPGGGQQQPPFSRPRLSGAEQCLGPELILDPAVASVEGSVTVYRNNIRCLVANTLQPRRAAAVRSCRRWSQTTSAMPIITAPVTRTCISSARGCSADARTLPCKTGTGAK